MKSISVRFLILASKMQLHECLEKNENITWAFLYKATKIL